MADWLNGVLSQHGLWWGLPAVFLVGLSLNLTPCVYPMIPVTFAFFSSQAAGSLGRAARLAGCYVLGVALMYAALGLAAAKTGALFGSWLQHPAVLAALAAVIVALALSMFGLYELRPPRALIRRLGTASAGAWGAFLMGAVVGLVAAPCIGPVVLSLLLLVSQLGDPFAGFLLFLVMGLGMGAPYVALGVAADRVGQLPKAGAWLVWSKKALGLLLLGLALFFLKPLLPGQAPRLLGAALLAGGGMYLGWLERSRGRRAAFTRVRRVVGGLLIAAALVMAVPRPRLASPVAWIPYTAASLEEAQRSGRPILIDIYADWCIPCVEMEHVTFRDPTVAQALQSVATLRVDATRGVSKEAERFLSRHRVYGAPTMLFFDRTGHEREDLRLLGFAAPDEFLERLQQVL
ncbi:MAG: thioredoxin family protein [Candidatus Omnitrophica bacterium]|nr:thioredoxin family protein [Candidatus Omnitrophota bacterium]